MNRLYILLFVLVCMVCINHANAQTFTNECNPAQTDPGMTDYCQPVPLDENVIYLVIGTLVVGFYAIKKRENSKRVIQ